MRPCICGQHHGASATATVDPMADPEVQEQLRIAKIAMQLPTPALLLLPAKTFWVCRRLGMSEEATAALLQNLDARKIVIAALDNPSLKAYQTADLCTNPPMRVEFEHTTVFGAIGEAADLADHKSWGKSGILALEPLRPDDRLDPVRITYQLKATSHMRQRWEWRDTLKAILKTDRRLVKDAMYLNKTKFTAQLAPVDRQILQSKLEMEPAEFWVACRHGDRRGPGACQAYVNRVFERTKGYTFDFGETV